MKSRLISLFVLVAFATSALAQDTRGKVQGTVSDQSGAVMPGIPVILRDTGTNVQAVAQTNQEGHYLFNFVIPGSYTITVETAGFRTFIQKNIQVEALSDITVNANLLVGNTGESVTVEATPVAVEERQTAPRPARPAPPRPATG